jgi:hypothetical protein
MKNDVTKFVTKMVVLIAISVLVVGAVNHFYIRTRGYKGTDSVRLRFESCPRGLNVINLGTSHSECAFGYDGIDGIKGFNFALSSQDFYYDLEVLKHFKDRLAPGCVVILPVSYFSLGWGQEDIDRQNTDARYYCLLGYSSVRNKSLIDYIKQRFCPALFASRNLMLFTLGKGKQATADQNVALPGSRFSEAQLPGEAEKRARLHMKFMKGNNYANNLDNLSRVIEYCKTNELRPVLLTTPFTSFYNDCFPREALAEQWSLINRLCDEYDLQYFDYSHDPRFSPNPELFNDSDHLNIEGQEIFTRIVIDDLKERDILSVEVD